MTPASQPSEIQQLVELIQQSSEWGFFGTLTAIFAVVVAVLRPQLGTILTTILTRQGRGGSPQIAAAGLGSILDRAQLEQVADARTVTIVQAIERSGQKTEEALERLADIQIDATRQQMQFTAEIKEALNTIKADARDAARNHIRPS